MLLNLLDQIDNNILIEVYIERFSIIKIKNRYYQLNNSNFEYHKIWKAIEKLQSFNFEDDKVSEICRKLFTKNIFDLRIVTPTDYEKLVELIANFCRSKVEGERKFSSKLRDLDLKLHKTEDTKIILNALSENYMIKTVRLSNQSRQRVDEETQKIAEHFKDNRVGTEVRISFSNKKFSKSKVSEIEVFYPDAL